MRVEVSGRMEFGHPSLPTQLPTKQAPDGLASLRAAVMSQPVHTHSPQSKKGKTQLQKPILLPASGDLE